jgi:hypothetical protein
MSEELARRIKEGAIPIISDVEGFRAYYVVYAPDDTNSDQHLQRLRGSRGVKQARARVDRAESDAPAGRASYGDGRAGDRAHLGVTDAKKGRCASEVIGACVRRAMGNLPR